MSLNSTFLLTAAFCAMCAIQARADESGLYAKPAPDDASFVRFVGFKDATSTTFAGKTFDLSEEANNAYVPVSSSLLTDIPNGSYITVLRNADGQDDVITEGARDTRSKVHLFLVNGTDTALDLRLADNSATVIDGVGVGQSGQRGVNPLSVTLGVFSHDGQTPLETFEVTLKRGQNISFVADDRGIHLIENRFDPVAK
jgi:hypothetical protein